MDWNTHLAEVRKHIPPHVQLDELRINHICKAHEITKRPQRVFELSLTGKGVGAPAVSEITLLHNRLESSPILSPDVQEIMLQSNEDPENPANRTFTFRCIYKPRAIFP